MAHTGSIVVSGTKSVTSSQAIIEQDLLSTDYLLSIVCDAPAIRIKSNVAFAMLIKLPSTQFHLREGNTN